MKYLFLLSLLISQVAFSQTGKKILVVFSSEDKITVVKDRATGETTTHPTGFFLSELIVTLKAAIDAGYQPVYASPKGGFAVMDKVSDAAYWFGNNESEYKLYRSVCVEEGICGDSVVGTKELRTLQSVLEEGLDSYAGIFLPGGHAPMEDLYKDKTLGKILKAFHTTKRPTALICHAPIALLSTLDDAQTYGDLLQQGKTADAAKLASNWVYKGYRMTSFSTKEEQQEEPGQDNVLGGYVRFYPDEALDFAGGKVVVRAQKWQSNVIRDRELITGQNPMSDHDFGFAFVNALKGK